MSKVTDTELESVAAWRIEDGHVIRLSEEEWQAFLRQLDNPSPPNKALRDLLQRKPVWEE